MAWDDDKKAAVIEAYENAEPTPETSMEIVKDIADEFNESPNGVRMVLSKAGVYIKKTPAASGAEAPFFTVQALTSFAPAVKYVCNPNKLYAD